MSEIPGPVWMGVGAVIEGFSLFLGFIRPVEYNMFFKLMTVIGGIMILFGFIRSKLNNKNKTSARDESRLRQNPQGYQNTHTPQGYGHHNSQNNSQPNTVNRAHHQTTQHQPTNHQATHQTRHRQHAAHQQATSHNVHHQQRQQTSQQHHAKSKFCHQCGTPLLNHQKFCAICGVKV